MVHALQPFAEPPEPIDALRRVAFLLERSRAGTYRVEAFRGAVKLLKALPAGELEQRVKEGTLQQVKGIGKATAGVIEAAARGERAAYLTSLEESVGGPLVSGGEESMPRCRATATCTPTGRMGAARSTRWCSPEWNWATRGWC